MKTNEHESTQQQGCATVSRNVPKQTPGSCIKKITSPNPPSKFATYFFFARSVSIGPPRWPVWSLFGFAGFDNSEKMTVIQYIYLKLHFTVQNYVLRIFNIFGCYQGVSTLCNLCYSSMFRYLFTECVNMI